MLRTNRMALIPHRRMSHSKAFSPATAQGGRAGLVLAVLMMGGPRSSLVAGWAGNPPAPGPEGPGRGGAGGRRSVWGYRIARAPRRSLARSQRHITGFFHDLLPRAAQNPLNEIFDRAFGLAHGVEKERAG